MPTDTLRSAALSSFHSIITTRSARASRGFKSKECCQTSYTKAPVACRLTQVIHRLTLKDVMNSWALAALAAFSIISSEASGAPFEMFSRMVPWNKTGSCPTYPICSVVPSQHATAHQLDWHPQESHKTKGCDATSITKRGPCTSRAQHLPPPTPRHFGLGGGVQERSRWLPRIKHPDNAVSGHAVLALAALPHLGSEPLHVNLLKVPAIDGDRPRGRLVEA